MLHEAVQHEGDGADGSKPVIGTVMRQGYKLGDHVLRHALVGVVDTVADDSGKAVTAPDPGSPAESPAAGTAETGQPDTDDNGPTSGE